MAERCIIHVHKVCYCVMLRSNIIGMAFVRGKSISTYIVYEHTYFSIFFIISFVADVYDSRAYLEYVLCFYK